MKMKLKALTAATMLALSGTALADINPGTGSPGAGELFFSIWSAQLGQSVTRDLGININNFLTTSTSVPTDLAAGNAVDYAPGSSIAYSAGTVLDAGYKLVFGVTTIPTALLTAADAVWNVVGVRNFGNPDRLVTTANNTVTSPTLLSSAVTGAASSVSTWLTGTGGVNSVMPGTSFATNDTTALISTPVLANANSTSFNKNLGSNTFDTSGNVGQSLSFWGFAEDTASGSTPSTVFGYSGATWTLANDGTLTYEVVAGSPVPLPGALVLLASGLLGLFGVSRRRAVAA
jgi:hypothetical protein